MTAPVFELDLLPEPVALCQLPTHSNWPDWIGQSLSFLSVTRTGTELSVIIEERVVPADLKRLSGYRVLGVKGPIALHVIGVTASLAGTLANAAVPIIPIGTVDTDYLLVHQSHIEAAVGALRNAGHIVRG